MKKVIPVIVAIVLIFVVLYVTFGKEFLDKHSYGDERADLNEYFEVYGSEDVPVVLSNEMVYEHAKLYDGTVYFDSDTVKYLFTDRFYFDKEEGLLLYTTPVTTIVATIDEKDYLENGNTVPTDYVICRKEGGEYYIALEYVKKFVNLSYELFDNPNHLLLHTSWGSKSVATINADKEIRWRAGVKSEIIKDVKKGDKVETLEVLDDWTRVMTEDAYIGYIETKFLDDEHFEDETPVNTAPVEEFSTLNTGKRINLVWHNIEYPQNSAELYTACAKLKEVNVISPTWFWLTDNDGDFTSIATESYIEAAHKMDMEIWALVANFHSDTNIDIEKVLSATSKRTRLEEGLVNEAVRLGIEGINVDFETLPASAGDAYIQFIRELSLKCHECGLILSVDNYVPSEYTAFYNREEQGKFADYVIIMGYDEHYAGGEVGSVSSIPWMSKGIQDTIEVVPKEKVINAVPFYTRIWKTTGGQVASEAVTMATANDFLKRNGFTTSFDGETNQNYAEGTVGDTFYQVWMEDLESLQARLNIINTLDIAGVASWKLGQEVPEVWDYFESFMNQ